MAWLIIRRCLTVTWPQAGARRRHIVFQRRCVKPAVV